MSETVNLAHPDASSAAIAEGDDPSAMERRIFRMMCATVVLSVAACAVFAPWRVTTGVLTGGLLSLFNQHWLRTSVAAIFSSTVAGARPRLRIARYILRYVIMAAIITSACWLNVVSLPATLAGMCTFAVAALAEGFMQLYLAIVHGEET